MIQRCFSLPYYVYCLRLRCLVSFLFYSTIKNRLREQTVFLYLYQFGLIQRYASCRAICIVFGLLFCFNLNETAIQTGKQKPYGNCLPFV
ncbi:Uncharacterised protein [Neisseria animalis]|nr:Uncharacterised protein [Neisseria animalis]